VYGPGVEALRRMRDQMANCKADKPGKDAATTQGPAQ
jgi:hypothetical protein